MIVRQGIEQSITKGNTMFQQVKRYDGDKLVRREYIGCGGTFILSTFPCGREACFVGENGACVRWSRRAAVALLRGLRESHRDLAARAVAAGEILAL